LYITGSLVSAMVVMQIPVALNLLMQSFQPMFVFAIGVAIRFVSPKHATEAGGHVPQKILAIMLCAAGMYYVG
jgi:hypothetical protein